MVPAIVWVSPAPKVRVSAVVTDLVRLLKEVESEMVWEVPSKVTVPELWVKIPPEWAKFPDTFSAVGAVRVPEERVKAPFTSTVPELPVSVPPDMVNPPLKVCVAVED